MRAVVFAYHNIGCAGIEALLAAGYEIAAVFTHVDDPKETIFFSSVAELAAERGIKAFAPEDPNHPVWVDVLRGLKPDVIFSFYYRQMLSEELLNLAPKGSFNLHGSLLPRYRGRAPVNWAIINGETETGVTLHKMVKRPDAGDIVGQLAVPISNEDTAADLHHKMTGAARKLLDELLPRLKNGSATFTPQNEAEASYFHGRKPADGKIDWTRPAREIYNLIRAVTRPFPGAFTWSGQRKLTIWSARFSAGGRNEKPGAVLSLDPFVVACGEDALEITAGQTEDGLYLAGPQLAGALSLTPGMRLEGAPAAMRAPRPTRVLILGANGFIGNHLTERLLNDGNFEVYGLDIGSESICRFLGRPNFHFVEGDISIHTEWIEYHIKKCDVVLPLVAIATPIEYTRNPLRVFELDFEENLKIVRYCVKYNKRIIFPSTSEVYGMCDDPEFDEDTSNLILGPINKQRWIYSAIKQLLDRVIWAYGQRDGLRFTLFRPFNWMGPRLDSLDAARIGSSRAITQLILNLVEGTPINLVDGGEQKRCFTDISDGIEALYRIIVNEGGRCDGQIVNIGNPDNEASIRQLAEMLLDSFERHPLRGRFPPFAGFNIIESGAYYGKGYQDMGHRRPSIKNARRLFGWEPKVPMAQTVAETLDFFLHDTLKREEC